MTPSFLVIFLGSVFLLLPLAQERLFPSIPLYQAEIPLLFVGVFLLQYSSFWTGLYHLIQKERLFFFTQAMVVGGAMLSLAFSGSFLDGLGLLKSFVFLPILFMLFLALIARSEEYQRHILLLWWVGLVGAALASLWLYQEGILTYDGRLASFYASPNYLAMLLAPGVLLSWWFLDDRWSWRQGIIWTGAAILLGALILTRSYAVILATLFLSVVRLLPLIKQSRKTWRIYFFLGISLLILGWWGSQEMATEKFHQLFDYTGRSSTASRLIIWEVAMRLSYETFPWGIGLGNFQDQYLASQSLFPPYLEWAVPEPHNLFLSLFLSTGIIGFIGYLWGTILISRRLMTALAQSDQYTQKTARLLLGLLSWFWLVGLVDTPFFRNDLAFVWWGVLGIALALTSSQKTRD